MSAPASTTSGDVDPLFCCPVCLHAYNDTTCVPKLLVCFHSSCAACLEGIRVGRTIKCPTCRKETGASSAQLLSTNFYMVQFRDLVAKKYPLVDAERKKNGIWCKTCASSGVATIDCVKEKHELSDYDEYVAFLKDKRHALIASALKNKERLLKQNDDLVFLLRSLHTLSYSLVRVVDVCEVKVFEHTHEIDEGLREDAGEVELTRRIKRLESLEEWANTEGKRTAHLGKFWREVGGRLEGVVDEITGKREVPSDDQEENTARKRRKVNDKGSKKAKRAGSRQQ